MKDCLIEIGRIVYSKFGRDAGKYFIIYDIIDENYVYIVNGSSRKTIKPKKKKIKHLALLPTRLDSIREKLLGGKMVFDSEVRSAIEKFINTQSEEGLGV